jgi:hypothetical protein
LNAPSALFTIKILHTLIWLFFVTCILALPLAGFTRHFRWAAALAIVIVVECVLLAFNHFHCPLTDLAAHYTEDRAPNFDIFLPAWLARNNQIIFGTLFVAGGLLALWKWLSSPRQ